MKKVPYLIVGGLLIIAILFVTLTNDQQQPLEDLVSPTPTPPSPSEQILGEEASSSATQQIPDMVSQATILTSKGTITITLFPDAAPETVKNFAEKALGNYYNNLTFHRVEDWVAQGGDPLGNGTGGGQMPTELNNNPFIRGSVGVARGGNIQVSNDSQFFITKTDASWLNEQYTNFGQVTSGMDVVDSLEIGDKILSITVK